MSKDDIVKEAEEVFGAEAKNEWEEVADMEGEMWEPQEGGVIEGLYINKKENVGENKSNIYEIELSSEPGTVMGVWGSTVLDAKMQKVDVGREVRITFVGLRKSEHGGRDYKLFKVQHRMATMKEA